jgi:hypothetical protein
MLDLIEEPLEQISGAVQMRAEADRVVEPSKVRFQRQTELRGLRSVAAYGANDP